MKQSIPDEELMGQVRNGVGEMLGQLFERYQSRLFSVFWKLTGDRSVSEDFVQEVFLRLLNYRHIYHPETPFRACMYQIARSARVDHFRKKRPEAPLEREMAPAVVPNDLTLE